MVRINHRVCRNIGIVTIVEWKLPSLLCEWFLVRLSPLPFLWDWLLFTFFNVSKTFAFTFTVEGLGLRLGFAFKFSTILATIVQSSAHWLCISVT